MKNYLSNLASMFQGIAGVISDGERVQKECPAHLKSALLANHNGRFNERLHDLFD